MIKNYKNKAISTRKTHRKSKIYIKSKTYKKMKIYKKLKMNKRRFIKGGFISQNIINITYSSNLIDSINTALQPIFDILPSFSKDLIYVSFGSKLNETNLERQYLMHSYSYSKVNSGYQMVPFFLCKNSNPRENILCDDQPCKVLNIVVDIFNDNEDIENSKRHITDILFDRNYMDKGLDTSNITQFFINILDVRNGILDHSKPYDVIPHCEFLGNLTDILSKKMRENEIDIRNYMVCNYIKYKHPNLFERSFEIKISEKLSQKMFENGYENSYYEWLGYNPMVFYNCIMLKKHINLIKFLLIHLKNFRGSENNQEKIYEITKREFFSNPIMLDIFKYIFPIKSISYEIGPETGYPEDRLNNFSYSIYDLMS